MFKENAGNSFVLEKQFRFEGCTEWVTKMVYEPDMNRVYAISEQSVSVLNFRTRAVKVRLDNIHDAPLTCVCWYPVDQFYITSCSRGLVRIWSPHHSGKDDVTPSTSKPTLLHSFNAHTKAVAGIALHPLPCMLLSAGLDGLVKVYDLESFCVLQCFDSGQGISDFRMSRFQNYPVCLFSFENGDMTMWRVDSCWSEYGSCASDVLSLTCFESLLDPRRLKKHKGQYSLDSDSLNTDSTSTAQITIAVNVDPDVTIVPQHNGDLPHDIAPLVLDDDNLLPVPHSLPGTAPVKTADVTTASKPATAIDSDSDDEKVVGARAGDKRNIIAFSGLDLQVLVPAGGVLKSRAEAEQLIDGVRTFTFSAFQQLLFCVMESGDIRIFCTKSPTCVLLREIFVGSIGTDHPLCLALCDGLSLTALRSSTTSKDMRGNPSPVHIDEALLVGTTSGTLLILDTFQECATISVRQIFQGRAEVLKYRKGRSELIGLGHSAMSGLKAVRVWKLPEMTFMHEIVCDPTFSCWEISPTMNYVCVGCNDGFSRLFNLIAAQSTSRGDTPSGVGMMSTTIDAADGGDFSREVAQGTHIEVLRQEGGHEAEITSITFCDEMRAYATAAMDCTVKFWDYEKRYIRAILFDTPPRDILFNPEEIGSILVIQNTQIVSVSMSVWEGNGLLQKVREEEDPWDMGWLEEDAPTRITSSRSSRRTTSRGKSRPSSKGDSNTFLTEEQMQQSLLEMFSSQEDKAGLISPDEYWKYYSTLGNMTTIFPKVKRPKKVLNVRRPKFEMPVRESRKRFANKLKQKAQQEEQRAQQLAKAQEEEEAADEVRLADAILPSRISSADGDKVTSRSREESPHEGRHAFIRSAKAIQSMARVTNVMNPMGRKSVAFTDSNRGQSDRRSTNMIAVPPSGGPSSKSALSIIQQRNLIASTEAYNAVEYSEEYYVKPNGPPAGGVANDIGGRFSKTGGAKIMSGSHRNAIIRSRGTSGGS